MEEEFQKEQLVKNKLLILASFTMVIILVSSIFIVLKRYTIDKTNNNDNNDKVTHSDDDINISENKQTSTNKAYLYCSGYKDYAPIAFTYDCKSKECAISAVNENIFLYDDNTLKYREMTVYENNQINATDGTPKGENLSSNNFKDLEKIKEYVEFSVPEETNKYGVEVYNYNGKNVYVVDKNKKEYNIYVEEIKYEKNDILNTTNKRILFDYETLNRNYILYFNNAKDNVIYQIYDIKNNEVVYDFTSETIDGENVFYKSFKQTPLSFVMDKQFYKISNMIDSKETNIYLGDKFKFIEKYTQDDIFYIREDKIYTVKDNQLNVTNTKNEKNILKDKVYLDLQDNIVLYIENNYIKVIDIITNEIRVDSEITLERDNYLSFQVSETNYIITYKEELARQDMNWESLSNTFYENNKSCYQTTEELIAGYRLIINNSGEIISKELIVVNNKC